MAKNLFQLVGVLFAALIVFGVVTQAAAAKHLPKNVRPPDNKPYMVVRANGTVTGYDYYSDAQAEATECNIIQAKSCSAWMKKDNGKWEKIPLGEKKVRNDWEGPS